MEMHPGDSIHIRGIETVDGLVQGAECSRNET